MSISRIDEDLCSHFVKEVNTAHQLLDSLQKSDIILDYLKKYLDFFVYSYLIVIFFNFLRREHIRKLKLPSKRIKEIKLHYGNLRKQIAFCKKLQTLANISQINEEFYLDFKDDIENNFPEFMKLISVIEEENHYTKITSILTKEKKLLTQFDNKNTGIISLLNTKKLEIAIRKGKLLLSKKEEKKFVKSFKDLFEQSIIHGIDGLNESAEKALKEREDIENLFNDRLYEKWKKPLDLLRLLIVSSSEIGEGKIRSFGKKYPNGRITNLKEKALILINARSIQTAYEIFTLVKMGYADGANARWRTLFELMVIFVVIANNPIEFAKRYFEHQLVKKYKLSKSLKEYHKRLGQSFSNVNHSKLESEYLRLIELYGKYFVNDYGWIPNTWQIVTSKL